MAKTKIADLAPDQRRAKLIELKQNALSLAVVFYVARTVIDDLGIGDNMDPQQLDTVIFNRILDTVLTREGAE